MSKPTHDIFRENLRRRLREIGWTQRDFARKAQWTEPYVSQLLSGKSVPSLNLVDRIAEELGTTSLYLLTPVSPENFQENPEVAIDAA